MQSARQAREDLAQSVSSLHISKNKPRTRAESPIADSWEAAASSDDDTSPLPTPPTEQKRTTPTVPPPTPSSPALLTPQAGPPLEQFLDPSWSDDHTARTAPRPAAPQRPERRQETTDAVAKRLIAGALGIKAPRKTEEQRAYERAVREKERKRREVEKEEERRREEEKERARRGVWED